MKGLEYVEKAIALDPNLAPAYATRAWLKFQKYWVFGLPWATQIKEFESDLRLALSARSVQRWCACRSDPLLRRQGPVDRIVRRDRSQLCATIRPTTWCFRLPPSSSLSSDDRKRASPWRTWSCVSILRCRRLGSQLSFPPIFSAANSSATIEMTDQVPEESIDKFTRFFRAASYAFLGRAKDAERAKADLIAKNGEQVRRYG